MFKKLFAITALSALTAATLNASEPVADDIINEQPHPVLTHVFMHAVTGDNPQNPVDLMLVCKNWHRVINGDSFKNEYKKNEFFLDLTQHTNESAEKWVDNELLSRSHLIQHVHIEGRTPGNIFASWLPEDLFPSKFMECQNLTSLKVCNNDRTERSLLGSLPKFSIDPFAGDNGVDTRLKKEFKLIENLKVLELEEIHGSGRNIARFLLWVIPNLKNLEKLAINPYQGYERVPLMNWRDMPALKEIVLNSSTARTYDGVFETPEYIFNKVAGQWESNGPDDDLGRDALDMLTKPAILPRE